MKKIAVLVSGGGTNLGAIIDAQKSGAIKNGRVELVLSSNPDAYALVRARENNIKSVVLDRKEFPDRALYSRKLIEILRSYDIDLIVLAGFMCILDRCFTDTYKNKIMNVHPALIPSFSGDGFFGLRVHAAALEKGVRYSGATVHFVNEITDGGPIILQKPVKVMQNDTPESLQKRIMRIAEWKILPEAIELFCADRLFIENEKVKINI